MGRVERVGLTEHTLDRVTKNKFEEMCCSDCGTISIDVYVLTGDWVQNQSCGSTESSAYPLHWTECQKGIFRMERRRAGARRAW